MAGLRLSLSVRTAARPEDEPSETAAARAPEAWFKGCPVDRLPVFLAGSEADAATILEQVIAHRTEVFLRAAARPATRP